MAMLRVDGLTKRYDKFTLDGVSFSLDEGSIMGLIGRNGAGKTTTLKSMLGYVHADGGSVEMFGRDFWSEQQRCKQELGVVFGGFGYYKRTRLKTIARVTSRFYQRWSDTRYLELCRRFELDQDKRVSELSDGMRAKFSLALALSHEARLLILDEPTSGLDPVSRDELLELFQELVEEGGRSILFSTHITTDLERCADHITYIRRGKVFASTSREGLLERYREVKGLQSELTPRLEALLIGCRKHASGYEGLVRAQDAGAFPGCSPATLDSIMIHLERE